MTERAEDTGGPVDRLFASLAARRYSIYLGGLGAVVLARAFAPTWTRTPVFVLVLTLMCTTYLAELHGRAESGARTLVVTLAITGVAVGAFVAAEVNPVGGFLFVLGGLFFFRAATRGAA